MQSPYIPLTQKTDCQALSQIIDLIWDDLTTDKQQEVYSILDDSSVEYTK